MLIGREHWAGVIETATGDEGARRYLAAHDVTEVDCTGLADPTDLDVPARSRGYRRAVSNALIARVVDEPLSVAEHEDAVADKRAGAVVCFCGVVRDHDGGRSVTELEYVGHPTATDVITEIAQEFAARDDVHAVAVSHRIGLLGIGDVALACAVSAAHRGQAFAACADLVDEVKKRLPIWKRQVFTDGEEEWVACP